MGCEEQFNKIKSHIPSLPMVFAILCLILNIIIPGTGTLCFICFDSGNLVEHLIVGLLQLFLCWTIVCWVWSICWGVFALMRAK